MNKLLGMGAIVGAMMMASSAFAAPVGAAAAGGLVAEPGLVTTVAQGCGPGGFRNPYGRCIYGGRPGYGRPVYGRPVYGRPVYAPRRCWNQMTPYGMRRVCR